MKFLLVISLRNLFRQKRRNLLLGAAMSIGMAVLTLAHAFSHGISDLMFNRILAYVTGHVTLAFSEKGNINNQIFRDGETMLALARKVLPPDAKVEEGIGLFSRVVGEGVSDNVILVGIKTDTGMTAEEKAEMRSNFGMTDSAFRQMQRSDIENPVLVAADKAKYLRVKQGDALRARFQDVFGRSQAVRLTVAGIFKPANIFMSAPVFLDAKRLKVMAGYGPHDISGLHITLKDSKKTAIPNADVLHAALKPPLAIAYGEIGAGEISRHMPATVLGFRVDTASLRGLAAKIGMTAIDPNAEIQTGFPGGIGKKSILIGATLADSLKLAPGASCTLSYAAKHRVARASVVFKITGILPREADLPGDILLVNDKEFYGFYYSAWPAPIGLEAKAFRPDSTHWTFPFLNREWLLMNRTATTEAMQQKYRDATRLKTKATLVDVQTMYESASMVIKLEYALNIITLSAVLILFFIIQVGVVNTLRMTIRERTREIGTMRAIGMQRGDVRAQFLMETFFLSFAACLAGLVLAFFSMAMLSRLQFQIEGNALGMILDNGRLYFRPTLVGTSLYLLLILAIAVATAWFPARRAANLSAAEALRHFG